MDGTAAISADSLLHAVIILLYSIAGLASHRLLLPHLTRPFNRLAVLYLVAQILVIAAALLIQPSSGFERWVWHLDFEWNIPSTLSSTLLALSGGALWAAAWLVRKNKNLFWLYLLLLGLAFLYLGTDEYLSWKSPIQGWKARYSAFGAVIVVATAFAAWHTEGRTRIWLGWLVAGLAISAAGGIVFDLLPWFCDSIVAVQLEGCLPTSYIEETLEFIGIWLMLVAALGLLSESGPISASVVRLVVFVMPLAWLLSLMVLAFAPHLELRIMSKPADVQFERSISLRGYRFDDLSDRVVLQLYVAAKQKDFINLGFSIHFVDQVTGKTVASRDKRADYRHIVWILGPDYEQIYRQQMEISIPPDAPTNRALWVVLTTWRQQRGDYRSQRVLSSDHRLLNETQLVLAELALPAASAAEFGHPLAIFDNSFLLSEVELPQSARAGETMNLRFSWRAHASAIDDYVQFLHLGHVDSGEWWAYDQQPLGQRLPTRLWYSGLADSEVWAAPLPVDLAPGEYAVYTGLYRLRDKERLPVTGKDGIPFVDWRVPLGLLTLE